MENQYFIIFANYEKLPSSSVARPRNNKIKIFINKWTSRFGAGLMFFASVRNHMGRKEWGLWINSMSRTTYFRSLIDKRIRISYNFHTLDYKQQTKDLFWSVFFISVFSGRPSQISSKRRLDIIESNEIESNRNNDNKAWTNKSSNVPEPEVHNQP